MNATLFSAISCIIVLLVTGCGTENSEAGSGGRDSGPDAGQPRYPVNVGDTQEQVGKALGEPNIEFPDGDRIIRWYSDYEVTTSNNVVIAVVPTRAEAERKVTQRTD